MSSPFEVRYLPTAEKDLNEIFNYVLKDNPGAAAAHPAKLSDIPHQNPIFLLGFSSMAIS